MFKSSDEAKKQILKDKHTLLEGYVPEFFFEQQFLKSTSAVSMLMQINSELP